MSKEIDKALNTESEHNYVKKFKDKKAIRKEGKNYKLNTLLNTDTKSVKIDIDWNE